ncbi:archaellin/type IV pilin N-terminal domain-containing protein [Salinirubellus sp. GCM10025818]|uniref:archaellin/type IV pilin N-terminal domain-containing protein n=1 Tax=Salinirubellus TaxID=2162630 RepID=UPI0030CC8CAD
MFENENRGQVGIGTLIIFIAMVLVAAVAAGVLVNTSGLLQSQAEDTSSDAQAQVSNQIDVVSATGLVDSSNDDIDTVTLVVKKSPGSDPIDLAEATIEYTSDSESATLTHAGATSASEFTTVSEKGDSATVLDDNGERVKILIDTSSVETSGGIGSGEGATLRVVDQSGATTVYGVNVPDVLTGQTYVRV